MITILAGYTQDLSWFIIIIYYFPIFPIYVSKSFNIDQTWSDYLTVFLDILSGWCGDVWDEDDITGVDSVGRNVYVKRGPDFIRVTIFYYLLFEVYKVVCNIHCYLGGIMQTRTLTTFWNGPLHGMATAICICLMRLVHRARWCALLIYVDICFIIFIFIFKYIYIYYI